MNRRKAITAVVTGAAAAATVSTLSAADTEIDFFVSHWRKSKALTLKVAEAMPAENYDYKPFADALTFGGELQHLAQAEGFYLGRFGKGNPPPAAPKGDTTKATTVKYLTESFDWAISVVGQLTFADVTKSYNAGRGATVPGLEFLYQASIHTAHTRGYAEMFMRNKGVVPPPYDV
jgi:uncharacterized damage-inducible protein DinB